MRPNIYSQISHSLSLSLHTHRASNVFSQKLESRKLMIDDDETMKTPTDPWALSCVFRVVTKILKSQVLPNLKITQYDLIKQQFIVFSYFNHTDF